CPLPSEFFLLHYTAMLIFKSSPRTEKKRGASSPLRAEHRQSLRLHFSLSGERWRLSHPHTQRSIEAHHQPLFLANATTLVAAESVADHRQTRCMMRSPR